MRLMIAPFSGDGTSQRPKVAINRHVPKRDFADWAGCSDSLLLGTVTQRIPPQRTIL
jgi:hypothetical protein